MSCTLLACKRSLHAGKMYIFLSPEKRLILIELFSYKMAENNRNFTCVACHPEEEIVITGDDTGRVVLWQGIFSKKTQAVFHWHTLPVNCVAFSTLGSHFYSGANESVLVKWVIENPNIKQFLPRWVQLGHSKVVKFLNTNWTISDCQLALLSSQYQTTMPMLLLLPQITQ